VAQGIPNDPRKPRPRGPDISLVRAEGERPPAPPRNDPRVELRRRLEAKLEALALERELRAIDEMAD